VEVIKRLKPTCLTRMLVFDFSNDTSNKAYEEKIYAKIKDIDISILVNNVGCFNDDDI
jgi:short-subunit dehydrogenase